MTKETITIYNEYLKSCEILKSRVGFKILGFDALFYVAILLSGVIFGRLGQNLQSQLGPGLSSGILAPGQEHLIAGLLTKLLILTFVLGAVMLFSWSITRAYIWTTLLKKTVTKKFVFKFTGLFIVWALIWGIPFYLMFNILFKSIDSGLAVPKGFALSQYIFILLFIYFSYPAYFHFTKSEKVFASIKNAFVHGIMHVPKLIAPYVAMVITLALMSAISQFIIQFLPVALGSILTAIVFFITFAWAKVYYTAVLTRVDKHYAK